MTIVPMSRISTARIQGPTGSASEKVNACEAAIANRMLSSAAAISPARMVTASGRRT